MLRVKIVCTIGPASEKPEILEQLIDSGMNVARLNMSHGDHAYHARNIRRIRTIAQAKGRPVAILGDLQGPKLRVGRMQEGGVHLEPGATLVLTTEDIVGEPGRVPIQRKDIPRMVKPGERILLDDGLLELEVTKTNETEIVTQVIVGGLLTDNKGMNLPNSRLDIPSLTLKDRQDVEFLLSEQVDWIALSFVRRAKDVRELRKMIEGRAAFGRTPPIIAKIEKPEAVEHIDEIIAAADGIMIARGDLGIETSPEAVPMVQKMIIRACNQTDKPVITATQMLDSMIRNPRPTRAEASDVANAVLDGSDAIMLSGETASGKYPIKAIQTMVKIAEEAERVRDLTGEMAVANQHWGEIASVAGAVGHASVVLAHEVGAAAILAPTVSGSTAKTLSRFRPPMPIVAVTPSPIVLRQLALYWGVYPVLGRRKKTTDEVVDAAVRRALLAGYVDQGDIVLVTGGVVGSTPGSTNLVTIRRIPRVLATGRGLGTQRVRGHPVRLRPGEPWQDKRLTLDDILIVDELDPNLGELLQHVGGLITSESGIESYAALAAVELGLPALVSAHGDLDALAEHKLIVLDASTGVVYDEQL